MHRVILGAGIVIMEGLTNLGALPVGRRVSFFAPFYDWPASKGRRPSSSLRPTERRLVCARG
jgi:kynurenine formamidase